MVISIPTKTKKMTMKQCERSSHGIIDLFLLLSGQFFSSKHFCLVLQTNSRTVSDLLVSLSVFDSSEVRGAGIGIFTGKIDFLCGAIGFGSNEDASVIKIGLYSLAITFTSNFP